MSIPHSEHCIAIALRGFVVTEDMHLSRVVSLSASKTAEGRSATFRVQGLGCFSLSFLIFLTSIAARFLVFFPQKTTFFEPSRGGWVPHADFFFFSFFIFPCFFLTAFLFICFLFFFEGSDIRAGRASPERFCRSRHQPTNQRFRVCKVTLATVEVATIQWFDSSGRKSQKKYDEQFTSSTSFSTSTSVLRHFGSSKCAGYASGICQQGESNADALYGPGGHESIIWRTSTRETSPCRDVARIDRETALS